MKVLLTGATGFLGSHIAEELLRVGHDVRALVRSPEKAARVFGARKLALESAAGDMSDAAAVARALDGCQAVIHAAATMYGNEEVRTANVAGVRHVLGEAAKRGLDPVVYISSIACMYPPPGPVLRVEDPVTSLRTTYGRSKAEGEELARELQARGAPVVCVYPAGIFGPDDPGVGETSKALLAGLTHGWLITRGGVSIVDVRDVARVVVAALEPGRGPRRYMCAGRFLRWPELADRCDAVTGRRLRRIRAPVAVLRGAARLLDFAKKLVPFEYPLTYEAACMMTEMTPCDSSRTCEELGISFRPTEETLSDAIRWLVRSGELDARHAGRLAGV